MLMSAFILKCHKMLLMSYFDKTVLNIIKMMTCVEVIDQIVNPRQLYCQKLKAEGNGGCRGLTI